MIDLSPLARRLAGTPLAEWANTLQAQLDVKMEKGHGDLERWQSALDALPDVKPSQIDLLNGLTLDTDCDDATRAQMREALMGLSPWRKGPFDLFGVHVDTEWHSDWKWSRVAPHIDLKGKRILDVGCGNGYYMWRMLGAGAHSVVGVAQAVDVLGADLQVDDKRRCQIPAHALLQSIALGRAVYQALCRACRRRAASSANTPSITRGSASTFWCPPCSRRNRRLSRAGY